MFFSYFLEYRTNFCAVAYVAGKRGLVVLLCSAGYDDDGIISTKSVR